MTALLRLAAAAVLAAAPAFAQVPAVTAPAAIAPAVTAPAVTATDAWARATPPGASVGAAYVTLSSPAGDKLLSASSPAAADVQVHEMSNEGGVMRMREVAAGLPLPPGQAVTLRPGGLHIMMTGLKAPLKPGDRLPLHLVFQSAPPLDVVAAVGTMAATAPPAH